MEDVTKERKFCHLNIEHTTLCETSQKLTNIVRFHLHEKFRAVKIMATERLVVPGASKKTSRTTLRVQTF